MGLWVENHCFLSHLSFLGSTPSGFPFYPSDFLDLLDGFISFFIALKISFPFSCSSHSLWIIFYIIIMVEST